TEQGLLRVALEYDRRGYRYQAHDWEQFDNREKLATWLRWANPDDGWEYGELPERFGVQAKLRDVVHSEEVGQAGAGVERVCASGVASLNDLPDWRELTGGGSVVLGITYGEDPRNFLRTATRANPYPLVQRLWAEYWYADAINPRIKRIQ